jgi:hypothetical protein
MIGQGHVNVARLFVLLTLLPLLTSCEYLVPKPVGFYSLGDSPRYRPVIGRTVQTQRETKLYYEPESTKAAGLWAIGTRHSWCEDGKWVELRHRIIPTGTLVTVRDVRSGFGAPNVRCISAYLILHLADSAPIKTDYGLGCYDLSDKTIVLERAPWEDDTVPEKTVIGR